MSATTETTDTADPGDGQPDGPPVGMFSLLQTIAIVAVAVVVAVGLTLFFTDDSAEKLNDVDVGFLSDMTTHHQGAITLGFDYLPNESDSVIGHTAREVILAQSQEIATMNNLLGQADDAGSEIIDDDLAMEWMGHPVDPTAMPGMATADDFEALSTATGLEADDLFSRLMILHHAAGVQMAEYAARHGENETVRSFAAKVAEIQTLEIGELNERRVALGLEPIDPEPFVTV